MLGIGVIEQLRDTIKWLNEEVDGEMGGEEAKVPEALITQIDNRIPITVKALRGIGQGQEGNGCMDEVIDCSSSRYTKGGPGERRRTRQL